MKQSLAVMVCLLVTALTFCSCDKGEGDVQDGEQTEVPVFTKQKVPSSARSKAVISKVAPKLIRELEVKGLSYGEPIFIRAFKEEMELEVWLEKEGKFVLFRTYKIAACSGTLGPKLQEGDGQAPEGFYYVMPGGMNPNSRYHLSFNIGYPNAYDRAHKRTGSAIMVHGSEGSIGCYAMANAKIEEIYALADAALRNGQHFVRVHCFPFRMEDRKLQEHRASQWFGFWMNLKQGYDWFEKTARPPNVEVQDKKYVFEEAK